MTLLSFCQLVFLSLLAFVQLGFSCNCYNFVNLFCNVSVIMFSFSFFMSLLSFCQLELSCLCHVSFFISFVMFVRYQFVKWLLEFARSMLSSSFFCPLSCCQEVFLCRIMLSLALLCLCYYVFKNFCHVSQHVFKFLCHVYVMTYDGVLSLLRCCRVVLSCLSVISCHAALSCFFYRVVKLFSLVPVIMLSSNFIRFLYIITESV